MSDLPADWARARLGDLGDYLNGRAFKESEWSDRGRPIIRIQNLTGSGRKFNYFDGEVEERYVARPGDLLISWAATLGAYIWPGPEAVVNQHIFKVDSAIDRRFHRYLIDFKLRELMGHTHGSGMVHITRKRFEDVVVHLPPLAEQRRIVEALEDHLSRLDAAQSQLAAALLRCRVLRDAAVAELVQGSDDWERHAIGSLLREPLRNGHSAPASGDGCGVRTLTITAVTVDDFSDANTKVTSADPVRVHDLWLEPGDILVQRSNTPELVGTTAMYNGPRDWAIFPDLLIRLRPCDRLLPEFLTAVLRSAPVRRHFRSKAKGLAGSMPKIDQPTIMSTMVPVPSIPEQRRVLEEYRRWNEKIDRLRTALEVADRRAVHLRGSLLRQAFSGRLVLQDPSDEPASALLDRLRAERAAVPNAAGRRARTG